MPGKPREGEVKGNKIEDQGQSFVRSYSVRTRRSVACHEKELPGTSEVFDCRVEAKSRNGGGKNENISAPPLPPRTRFSPISKAPPQPAVRQSKLTSDSKASKMAVSSESGDSGLQSDASSVRSSSLVSSCSSGLEELLAEEQKLKSSRIQRQLDTIQMQKEQLVKDMVRNEALGRELRVRLASVLTTRDMAKLGTFLGEQEKVVLLLLSLNSRLERAEEEAEKAGSLTDWEKESRRKAREEINDRLGEAGGLRGLNDHRLLQVLEMLEGRGLGEERDLLLTFVSTKEALLRVKNTCEQLERSIMT